MLTCPGKRYKLDFCLRLDRLVDIFVRSLRVSLHSIVEERSAIDVLGSSNVSTSTSLPNLATTQTCLGTSLRTIGASWGMSSKSTSRTKHPTRLAREPLTSTSVLSRAGEDLAHQGLAVSRSSTTAFASSTTNAGFFRRSSCVTRFRLVLRYYLSVLLPMAALPVTCNDIAILHDVEATVREVEFFDGREEPERGER
ncbi:uncharacterized protein PHACADRAFT_262867 [Phanerochaete carnosa HHB-10118-sp]|uniref:Uncharacterized protein n=1 Tax=Phanerochaete carnosa (strain HHB-10118-sp) TaxID=650164 RepID=K5VVX2_PHACS|nr:uncharacterized protein PHACADRAFT_262867 [Phanerochaete carnosa HHB-10118-sp]EKM50960.1 hypothetical protein PHACADRAFT_262867 [Phanerochaete carnosa HHB-10118-sp]